MQSLENTIYDLRLRLSYQRDIKHCNNLCFTETWLNDDTDNIELAGFSMHWQNRNATSGKTMGGGLCLFVNKSWCAMSKIKEVLRYCSPEAESLMISCRPHYLPREFSSILFVAVYLPPQNEAGTTTALNQLYKAKNKNAHPEVSLLVAGDFIAGTLKSGKPHFYQHVTCTTRGKKNHRPSLLHTQMHTKLSPALLANLTIILSS